LHRYFVERHGWHIDGLDRSATQLSEESISRQQVPSFLMDVFSEAFGQTGLMLHELAIFAATLEGMIHNEATDRLKDVYKVLDVATGDKISIPKATQMMEVYMTSLMLGQDTLANQTTLAKATRKMERTYPGWAAAQLWLEDVRETVAYLDKGRLNPFVADEGQSFTQVERSAQQVSERIGRYQDAECRELKDQLLDHEEGDSGRLLLSEFYKRGMDTNMQFVESPEFLRQRGALDETKPGEPRVIVANYILSQGNCLADMGFYSICCINECEGLLARLERDIAAPEASVARITATISNLSTSTVEAPRVLPQKMVRRLEEVAARNRGMVPLHGRLFAQWLHFLFPRECPYPHASGTHNPLTPAEWQVSTGASPIMNMDARYQYIDAAIGQVVPNLENDGRHETYEHVEVMRWSDEEEILYLPPAAPRTSQSDLMMSLFAFVALGCIAVAAVDVGRRSGAFDSLLEKNEKAHLV